MAATTRRRKAAQNEVIDPNSVNIGEFCQSQGINEQIFRLELMQFVDDADSTKTVKFDVAQTVSSTIQATTKALPQNIETPENLTTEALQPAPPLATEEPQKPQNSGMVTSGNSSQVSAPGQTATGSNLIPSALEEIIASSQETLELSDLVLQFRNQQILENVKTRDQELVIGLREQRLENRAATFDRIRDLNSRQPLAPDQLPELPGLADEISGLCNELGKQLNRAA